MARILFTAPPLVGHLNPALALAAVLERHGHEIAWAVHAERVGSRLPEGARVFSLDAGDAVNGIEVPAVRGIESVRLFFEDYSIPLAEQSLPLLEDAVRSFKPDVMVVDHQMPAGALVARKFQLPWVSLVTTTASILKLSPMLDAWVAEQYMGLQKRYLPPQLITERPDFSPYRVIVFSIEALLGQEHARVEAPYAFVGPTLGGGRRHVDFPWDWFKDDTKKLYVSLGTVSRDRDTRFFEVIMEALTGLDHIQAVMVAPAVLKDKAPPNVLISDFVPQWELLQKVDAVISHAGHNTVCETLSHDLPLIVAPIRDDQPVIARQVIDAGAGIFMRHGKVTANTARNTILELFANSQLGVESARLGAALRAAPGVEGAAEIVESLLQPQQLQVGG
ncbi:glycosyltransferase [Aquirhabdus parva]|uniref:Glycosyltransferase n=1 Tax=Aquirhabdus parva TaxID=2283318 RepID=A0A345P384_9GAMM|nr:nucleotide disphospho-sugar-binding domain-containing protein [Aquirhabdus parva]AXI01743.1 glycosyltransferase [Aquirhabdus parva]